MRETAYAKVFRLLASCVLSLMAAAASSPADETRRGQPCDDTLLMFVGEETKVLSIASRREQSAWQAPAIARVITRGELTLQGARTLSEALEEAPGFYMARKEWGSQPYLRGIPDSVLFSFDTVPIGSEVTKSIHHLDHDLALWPVKRIEIINGPGSVLWGPDAFAGIVNVVPLTGKDLRGVESGVFYGAPGDQRGFFLNAGHDGGHWDGFLSVSGRKGREDDRRHNIVRFKNGGTGPAAPHERLGDGQPDDAEFIEAYAHLTYDDRLTLSARISDNRKPYTMTGDDGRVRWPESRSSPFSFIKLEAKHDLDALSALKFTGFYSRLAYDHEVIDMTQGQKESTAYAEAVYDRSLMTGTGMLTGGLSYRSKRVEDAPIWNGYLPGYLKSNNPFFFPWVQRENYDSELWSVFAQFMKTIGAFDLVAGARHDSHEAFSDQTSLSAGVGWSPALEWRAKLLYGTAYRTPFARQLYDEQTPDFERIKSLNMQVAWERAKRMGVSATGFYQWIDNHVMADPYAGLSLPNNQDLFGVELTGYHNPFKTLKLKAGLTLMGNRGPDEAYRYLESIVVGPGGEVIKKYTLNTYPYDPGPDCLFNAQAAWRPVEDLVVTVNAHYIGPRFLLFPRNDRIERIAVGGAWRFDAAAVVENVGAPGLDVEIGLRNMTDQRYETPGTYDLMEAEPFSVTLLLKMDW